MGDVKFNRQYLLNIGLDDEVISNFLTKLTTGPKRILPVKLPFTMEFDIQRNTLQSANTSSIKVYNLSKEHRNDIFKDPFTTLSYRPIELKAGYGNELPTIFKGNINRAYSVRDGVNYITTIESYDGGFAFVNGKTAVEHPKDTAYTDILTQMVQDQPKISLGAIGPSFSGSIPRGNSFSGNSADLITELSGGAYFVDLETGYILDNSECITGVIPKINSDSGLIGTPRKEGTIVYVDMIFEPKIQVAQFILLETNRDSKGRGTGQFDGPYKVISLHHRGMISGAVCGDAVTSVGLWSGTKALRKI